MHCLRIAFPCIVVLLTGCRLEVQNGAISFIRNALPARTGPAFQEAFPDPAELLRTRNVARTREVLETIPLPETEAHHAALRRALAAADKVDTDHLLLLTEAVALPLRTDHPGHSRNVQLSSRDGRNFVISRGDGRFAPVLDELLLAGARKLTDPGPANFGRLLTVTQGADGLVELSDILLDRSDDGSVAALQAILGNIPFATIREELCAQILLPRQRLAGERMDVAVESMSFDSNRARLVTAIYATLEPGRLDPATLLRHVKMQSFDSGRVQIVQAGLGVVESLNGEEALHLVRTASFDSGRAQILQLAVPKLRLQAAEEVLALLRIQSYDSGRRTTLKALLGSEFPVLSDEDLIAIATVASYDNSRGAMLDMVAPHFAGGFTTASARRLLQSFSFDSGRLKAVETFRGPLQRLPVEARDAVLKTFSFSRDRDQARGLIVR